MKTLLVQSQLTKTSRVKDGTVTITFHTLEEIGSDQYLLMDQYWKQNGWLAFKMDELDPSEIPNVNTNIEGRKSQSVQLRNALFAKHMHNGGTKETFTAYYNKVMDGFIQKVTDSYA